MEYIESISDLKYCIDNKKNINVKNLAQYDQVRDFLLDLAEYLCVFDVPKFQFIQEQVDRLDKKWGSEFKKFEIKKVQKIKV